MKLVVPASLVAVLMCLTSCQRDTPPLSKVHFDLDRWTNSKIVEIAFLHDKSPWEESGELVPVAPPIKDPLEIAKFIDASKIDLPAKAGKAHLAGIVCEIVVVGENGRVLDSTALFSANAVLVPTVVDYVPQKGYISRGYRNVNLRPLPRRAPTFGGFVLAYLKRHNPRLYGNGNWLIEMD